MIVLLTTVPGIEDLVIDEVREKLGGKVVHAEVFGESNVTGKVLVQLKNVMVDELKQLGTVEHVVLILDEGVVSKSLDSLRDCIWKLRMDELLNYYTPSTSLGIDVDRSGDHEFRSPDASVILGDRITEFLGSIGLRPIFNLDNADLVMRLIIDRNSCFFGLSVTRKSLRSRPYRVFNHPAAINPIIANAMVRLLNPKPYTRVCDITCGSGTIVIEGSLSRHDLVFLCADIDYGYVKGAVGNAKEAGVDSFIDFIVMDSTMPPIRDKSCNYAVFNPPFGIRMEPVEGVPKLYRALFNSLNYLLDRDSVFVLITIRKALVRRLAKEYGFKIVNERVVEQGGIWSSIFTIAKD